MTHPIRTWSREGLAAVTFAAVAVTIAACSSNGTIGSPTQMIPNAKNDPTSSPTPYAYTFASIDHSQGSNTDGTRITGIDQKAGVITGVTGTVPNAYGSWVAHSPSPSATGYQIFRARTYPGAGGTYVSALSNAFNQAGTVFSPPPSSNLACTTCGFTYYNKGHGTGYSGNRCASGPCQWTFIEDPNEGTGSCAVTDVSGLDGSSIVVGYYLTGSYSCGSQAFEGYLNSNGTESFADFDVPGADANTSQATGINEKGNVVGTAQFGGVTEGWYYVNSTYYTGIKFPGASATYPLGLNWEDEVVGYYEDSKQIPHGFILFDPKAPASYQTWETVDVPQAEGSVVSDINTHHYITGWYADASGDIDGFVGTCTNCPKKHKKHGDRSGSNPASARQ